MSELQAAATLLSFSIVEALCSPQVRFLSDLVNCHVIAAPSMVAMFENFISVTQEEDVPQVCLCTLSPASKVHF